MPSQAALEPPSVGKAWRLVKKNASTWAVLWIWTIAAGAIYFFCRFAVLKIYDDALLFGSLFSILLSLPVQIISKLIVVHFTVVPAIFYATGEHPTIKILIKKFLVKPWRYFLAGLLFIFISILGSLLGFILGFILGYMSFSLSLGQSIIVILGFLLFIAFIIILLAEPIYVNLIFNTNLGIVECLSKSIKSMFKDFIPYFVISVLLLVFAIIGFLLCFIPVLIILPICQYYMQNFIYQKGYIS